jgi:hypothetical protein
VSPSELTHETRGYSPRFDPAIERAMQIWLIEKNDGEREIKVTITSLTFVLHQHTCYLVSLIKLGELSCLLGQKISAKKHFLNVSLFLVSMITIEAYALKQCRTLN